MDDEYFPMLYVIDTIPNLPAGHQIPTQAKKNVWIISINGEEPIKYQGALDECQSHQNQRRKSKVNKYQYIQKEQLPVDIY